jgi:DNA-binding transcriptional regulator YiaG
MTIKEIRQISGLNVRQFTEKYRIPYTTYHDWEKGNSNPPQYLVDLLQRVVMEDDQQDEINDIISF